MASFKAFVDAISADTIVRNPVKTRSEIFIVTFCIIYDVDKASGLDKRNLQLMQSEN